MTDVENMSARKKLNGQLRRRSWRGENEKRDKTNDSLFALSTLFLR
jgi:hypothetical protein